MQIAEIRTVAKSLPPLRWNTHKSLILSYSADFSVIFVKKPCKRARKTSHESLFRYPLTQSAEPILRTYRQSISKGEDGIKTMEDLLKMLSVYYIL